MKIQKPIAIVFLLLFLFSCGNRAKDSGLQSVSIREEEHKEPPKVDQIADTTQQVPGPAQQQPGPVSSSKIEWDKKIIKTANINIEVKDYSSFTMLIKNMIKKFGGYVAQEEENQSEYKIEDLLTIKVPVNQFDDMIIEISRAEGKIIEKKINSEDVTTAMVDTRSRMEAKKQVRLRYLSLLKQAKNMEEILNVQNEINQIQEDIEAATGRLEYLAHSSSFSTLNLGFFQVLNASALNEGKISFADRLLQSFKNGWSWIGDLVVGVISIWPLFVLIFFCWFAYKKWLLPRTQKSRV